MHGSSITKADVMDLVFVFGQDSRTLVFLIIIRRFLIQIAYNIENVVKLIKLCELMGRPGLHVADWTHVHEPH